MKAFCTAVITPEYQKILDANGLKESDTLAPGTVIKIPQ